MDEPGSPIRRSVIWVMGAMLLIWIALYFFSFNDQRGQADPADFSHMQASASDGKKVFQSYNCMGCHTIVGNGAYFAPDLTDTYATVGPAWLAAYLPSAGTWPNETLLNLQIQRLADAGLIEAQTPEAYYASYPGAAERVRRRGGQSTTMPNLSFEQQEINALIAFLEYTSNMHTEGWPPEIRARASMVDRTRAALHARAGVSASASRDTAAAASGSDSTPGAAPDGETPSGDDPPTAADGEALAGNYGCLACHATGGERRVGPGWGDLYGSEQVLTDGSTVKVDEGYLATAITEPDAAVPEGYTPGVMPSFAGQLDSEEVEALVAYIKSLSAGDE